MLVHKCNGNNSSKDTFHNSHFVTGKFAHGIALYADLAICYFVFNSLGMSKKSEEQVCLEVIVSSTISTCSKVPPFNSGNFGLSKKKRSYNSDHD